MAQKILLSTKPIASGTPAEIASLCSRAAPSPRPLFLLPALPPLRNFGAQ
jgi:hypothetical protein